MRSHERIHDVLAISAQMQPSISPAPLVGEVDVWWRTTEVSMGNNPYLNSTSFRPLDKGPESQLRYMDQYIRVMKYAGGAADTDTDQAYYVIHGFLEFVGYVG
ncbi:hypothetical protein Scep_006217 [Stephania cephalantha]|uniref:Uncharacterized protein n=1 Tax=Stephania cephalantha TaxID=152367 RepID=A0AAP0PMT5_9MAGN